MKYKSKTLQEQGRGREKKNYTFCVKLSGKREKKKEKEV